MSRNNLVFRELGVQKLIWDKLHVFCFRYSGVSYFAKMIAASHNPI